MSDQESAADVRKRLAWIRNNRAMAGKDMLEAVRSRVAPRGASVEFVEEKESLREIDGALELGEDWVTCSKRMSLADAKKALSRLDGAATKRMRVMLMTTLRELGPMEVRNGGIAWLAELAEFDGDGALARFDSTEGSTTVMVDVDGDAAPLTYEIAVWGDPTIAGLIVGG